MMPIDQRDRESVILAAASNTDNRDSISRAMATAIAKVNPELAEACERAQQGTYPDDSRAVWAWLDAEFGQELQIEARAGAIKKARAKAQAIRLIESSDATDEETNELSRALDNVSDLSPEFDVPAMLAVIRQRALPLPDLEGSPKQVAWATDMRASALEEAERGARKDPDLFAPVLAIFRAVRRAKTWIDAGRKPVDHVYNFRQMALAEGIAIEATDLDDAERWVRETMPIRLDARAVISRWKPKQ